MAKLQFSQLKPDQQKRKLSWFRRNQGLSPAEVEARYNAGTLDQTGARGHAQTPERPERAVGQTKYQKYNAKKTGLVKEIQDIKTRMFGGRDTWNPQKSLKHVKYTPKGKARGTRDLERLLLIAKVAEADMLTSKDLADLGADEDDYSILFYH